MTGAPGRFAAQAMSLATKGMRRAALEAKLAAYRALSVFGHEDYAPFIVLTRSRTGSNLLVSFLNGQPGVFCEGEIFARMRGRDPLARLDAAFGRQPRRLLAKGFKIFYYHPLDGGGEALWARLADMKMLRVIHLTRSNVLRTLLSRKIAGLQDAWTATKFDRIGVDARRVVFSVAELEQGFRQTRAWEEAADARFRDHAVLRISYEELLRDPSGTSGRALAHIGMRAEAPTTGLRRQNPENLRDLIGNYDELKRAFAGTDWQAFFDD